MNEKQIAEQNACLLSSFPFGKIPLKIQIESEKCTPIYASKGAAGADLKANIDENITILPGKRALISTGLKIEIPAGYEIQLRPRSGLALKHGIILPNSPATIDSDYRGEIKVILMNLGEEAFVVTPGMRIAQMILARVETASFLLSREELEKTERGSSGFGHTGTH
ncbi:MAG: dUTP diphosphatase [Chlamydia sp.]